MKGNHPPNPTPVQTHTSALPPTYTRIWLTDANWGATRSTQSSQPRPLSISARGLSTLFWVLLTCVYQLFVRDRLLQRHARHNSPVRLHVVVNKTAGKGGLVNLFKDEITAPLQVRGLLVRWMCECCVYSISLYCSLLLFLLLLTCYCCSPPSLVLLSLPTRPSPTHHAIPPVMHTARGSRVPPYCNE